jgi:two-component system, OmpR family, response regulator
MPTRKIKSVLYVDDDPDICAVVQANLCFNADLDVHIAGSGQQAIDLAYELRPDLILMDVMMPGLDGPSTLKRMQEHSLLSVIPVIFLTVKVLPAELDHFLRLGAIGVIGKPVDLLKLRHDILTLWNRSLAARGVEDTTAAPSQLPDPLGSLRGNFLQRTRNDVVRLRTIFERARLEDRLALVEAKRIAHSIHGAGAMFDFPQVSATGGKIERMIASMASNTVVSGPISDVSALQHLLGLTDQLARDVDASTEAATRAMTD